MNPFVNLAKLVVIVERKPSSPNMPLIISARFLPHFFMSSKNLSHLMPVRAFSMAIFKESTRSVKLISAKSPKASMIVALMVLAIDSPRVFQNVLSLATLFIKSTTPVVQPSTAWRSCS